MAYKPTIEDKIRQAKLQLGDDFGDKKLMEEAIFKAGMREGAKEAYEAGVYNGEADGIAKGIKEVVEAMLDESYGDPRVTDFYKINCFEWQAKLREWGID